MIKVNENVTFCVDTFRDTCYYNDVTGKQICETRKVRQMIDAKEIGARLLALRGDISREFLAKEIEISVSAIAMYENGERIPRDDIKVKLANFYNRTVQEIFFDKERHTW